MTKTPRPTPADTATITERRKKAFDLRKGGLSLRDIAEHLGVSHETVRNDIETMLEETRVDIADIDAVRRLEIERLDGWLIAANKKIAKGDVNAVHIALKIQERRARYLGLDAPAKQETTIRDWRLQAIEDIKAGTLTYSALAQLFDSDLASELFQQAGVPIEG